MSRHRLFLTVLLVAPTLAGCTNGVVYDSAGMPPQVEGAEPAATPEVAPVAQDTDEHADHAGHQGEAP